MHTLITHIVYGEIPEKGSVVQVTPICSTKEDMKNNKYYQGYTGSLTLGKASLSFDGVNDFFEFPEPIEIKGNKFIFIDSQSQIFFADTFKQPREQWEKIGQIG